MDAPSSSPALHTGLATPRTFLALALVSALLGSTTPSPLYGLYQSLWGFPSVTLSALYALYAFGVLIALACCGRLSDRLPDRRLIILPALGMVALGALLFAFADDLPELFLGRLLAGLGTGALTGSANAALMDFDAQDLRKRAASIATLAFTGGAALGPVLSSAALYLEFWPRSSPFLFNVTLALLTGLGLLLGRWPQRPAVPALQRAASDRESPLCALRPIRQPFAMLCAALVLAWSVGSLFVALGPTLLASTLPSGSLAAGGLVVAGFQLSAGASQFFCRQLQARPAIRLGSILLAVSWCGCVVSLVYCQGWSFCLLTLLAGTGYGASFVGAVGRLGAIAPAEHRGALNSLLYVAGYLGSALCILGIGAVVDAIGMLPAMTVLAGAVVLAAVALVHSSRFD